MLNRGLIGSSTRKESLLCSSGSARGQRSLCFPLGALGFGAFRRPAEGTDRASSVRFRSLILTLAGWDLQLVVLLTAQLSRDRKGAQRPLLVRLTERVGAELTEGLGVFPTDVAVVPGAVPAPCRGTGGRFIQIYYYVFILNTFNDVQSHLRQHHLSPLNNRLC